MNLHCYICKMWGHTKVRVRVRVRLRPASRYVAVDLGVPPHLANVAVQVHVTCYCYICKMWGHTKVNCPQKRCLYLPYISPITPHTSPDQVNCPQKRCRFCGKQGHVQENWCRVT